MSEQNPTPTDRPPEPYAADKCAQEWHEIMLLEKARADKLAGELKSANQETERIKDSMNWSETKTEEENNQLRKQVAELTKDKERLDALEKLAKDCVVSFYPNLDSKILFRLNGIGYIPNGNTLVFNDCRQAIDAAMRKE